MTDWRNDEQRIKRLNELHKAPHEIVLKQDCKKIHYEVHNKGEPIEVIYDRTQL